MTLQTNNKIVVELYKKNKHISFEEVNIFMVDMFEKIIQSEPKIQIFDLCKKTIDWNEIK